MEHEYSGLLSQETKEKIDNFVKFHKQNNTNVVLITSGGTTVPLEHNTVRFIDNFSIGTRGSASAEYFIQKSYAVLFVHRRRSLRPFERKFHNVNLLKLINKNEPNAPTELFKVNQSLINFNFDQLLESHQDAVEKNLILNVDFITVFEYFALLDYSCRAISSLEKNALVYLAAAVSDFYVPLNEMPEHKIQSSDGNLVLDLKPVPKMVGKLRSEWCPKAYVVTFKLETDPSLLLTKAKKSIEKYQHNCVIGNILEQRKNNVLILESNGKVTDIYLNEEKHCEIEEMIIDHLCTEHFLYKKNQPSYG
ncbi:phosphopantothenate--cysteine ligase [Brachionus plicatilis]|uniref:Phosphopantothenate--cysteine ligase n=1 Tax=Brachionus plicatilis TaxID=10195 RepID=A0A3M7PYR1_BRAPC|nr:phosphopantothenate--cysteine ligase [Brachionus plicatilis]